MPEYCDNNSKTEIALPVYQQIIDWFLEKHTLNIVAHYGYNDNPHWSSSIDNLSTPENDDDSLFISGINFEPMLYNTKTDALNKAIEKALTLI